MPEGATRAGERFGNCGYAARSMNSHNQRRSKAVDGPEARVPRIGRAAMTVDLLEVESVGHRKRAHGRFTECVRIKAFPRKRFPETRVRTRIPETVGWR